MLGSAFAAGAAPWIFAFGAVLIFCFFTKAGRACFWTRTGFVGAAFLLAGAGTVSFVNAGRHNFALPRIISLAACCGLVCTGVTGVGCCAALYFCLLLISGNGGCEASGFTDSVSAGMEAVCGCRVRICGMTGCSGSVLWETWSFCCSRTVSRVRMTGEKVSESAAAFSILLVSSLKSFCFFLFFRMYSFVLISGSANCVVSVFSAAGISRREETSGFSFGRVRAAGGVVSVVSGTAGSVIAGDCPSGCFFA